ncbi:MAG: flagellar assembly protein FliX [Pseudomonadota bacterium]
MRIAGPNATARVSTSSATAKRSSSGGFSVSEQEESRASAPAASLRTIGGIDALMALQGEDHVGEQRKRAVKRGRNALDVLDSLKAELLGGDIGPSTLARLKSAATDLQDASGDPGLDGIMSEIDLRLQVEIAKMTPREGAK